MAKGYVLSDDTGGITNIVLTNPDIDVGSDATGDVYYRDASGEFTRLGIQASSFSLHGGTVPAWETDYALTFGYQLTTSVATGDITITLLNYLGTTPSTTTPVRIFVGNSLNTITSAQTLTINNDSFYHFNAGSAELATYEIDYFVYWGDSTGLCVSRLPWYTNFAQQGANQEAFLANGGGFSTQALANIGRYNATKASGTTGNWSIPATSIIINKPIYYTRALSFTPTLQGSGGSIGTMTASPYTGTYTVRDSACFYRLNVQCTNVGSWSGNVELNLPWINKNEMGDSPVTGWVCPSGANPATASRAVPYTVANSNLQRHLSGVDSANLSWGTFVVNDRIRAEGFYNIA